MFMVTRHSTQTVRSSVHFWNAQRGLEISRDDEMRGVNTKEEAEMEIDAQVGIDIDS